jgi:hypothetical protein
MIRDALTRLAGVLSFLVVVVIALGRRIVAMVVLVLVLVSVVTVVMFMLGLVPIILVVMRMLILMTVVAMMVIVLIRMAVVTMVMVVVTVLAFHAGRRFLAVHVEGVSRGPGERGQQGKGEQAPAGAVVIVLGHRLVSGYFRVDGDRVASSPWGARRVGTATV